MRSENLIRKRYTDKTRLIADANELKLTDRTLIQIYQEDKWYDEVYIDLEKQAVNFEELKSYIIFIARNLCEIDAIVQKYLLLHGNAAFADDCQIAYLYFDEPDKIRITYYGTHINTEFDVLFQHINDKFILKSCGMVKNIPSDWDK